MINKAVLFEIKFNYKGYDTNKRDTYRKIKYFYWIAKALRIFNLKLNVE